MTSKAQQDLVAVTRKLVAAVRVSAGSDEELTEVRSGLESVLARLESLPVDEELFDARLHAPDRDASLLEDPCEALRYSPAIGRRNPLAPAQNLAVMDGRIQAQLSLGAPYAGSHGRVHGGVIALLFDELLAAANMVNGVGSFTRRLSVDFLAPTPPCSPLLFEASTDSVEGRRVQATGRLIANGSETARATGAYVVARKNQEQ